MKFRVVELFTGINCNEFEYKYLVEQYNPTYICPAWDTLAEYSSEEEAVRHFKVLVSRGGVSRTVVTTEDSK